MSTANAVQKVAPAAKVKEFKLTVKQRKMMDTLEGPSKRVRYLTAEGLTRVQIVMVCPNAQGEKIRYQHVRGIQIQALAKAEADAKRASQKKGGNK